jgi:hypothetical protein
MIHVQIPTFSYKRSHETKNTRAMQCRVFWRNLIPSAGAAFVAATVVGAFAAGAGIAAIIQSGLLNGVAGVDDAQATRAGAPHLVDVYHTGTLLCLLRTHFPPISRFVNERAGASATRKTKPSTRCPQVCRAAITVG